jgi:Peptidase family M23
MRAFRGMLALVATSLTLGGAMLPSSAGATGPGGSEAGAAQAPSAPLAGGSEYGVVSKSGVGLPPVVSTFDVPATAIAGKPPAIRFRVDSAHKGTVRVRVVVYVSSPREPVIAVDMGWVHTGRTSAVRWPRHARLAAGTYHVSIGAHGHRAPVTRLFAHTARTASLTVTAPPLTITPETLPAGVPTPAQTAALGAVFPVAGKHDFGTPDNRFGAPRSGHVHQGQDVLTAEGTPIVAPLAGTIIAADFQSGGAGYYLAEHTATGLDFFFAHCQAGSVRPAANDPVAAGEQLCAAGQTGDATTPHLHFEVWVGGWHAHGGYPIDPLPYLLAWDH